MFYYIVFFLRRVHGSALPFSQGAYLDWLMGTFNGWIVEKRKINIMFCWSIWKCKNELVWKQSGMLIVDVEESAKAVLSQW